MAKIELKSCGVVFDPIAHTYHLNGKQLSGITTPIHNQIAPDEFTGVSKDVMKTATERGHRIHASIQNFIENFEDDGSQELQDFIDLSLEYNLNFEASEVLITDFQNYASAIDLVVRDADDQISIGDIKTYGTMNPLRMLKLQYQLSIYAYMAELCWPGIKINQLFCIHLRNVEKPDGTIEHIKELVFVKRISPEICKSLLQAELDGTQFENPLSAIPDEIQSKENRIRELILLKQQCEEELGTLKNYILENMEALNVKTWTFLSGLKATRKLATTRQSLDTTKLKKSYPDIQFDDFMKISYVNPSLQLTI